MRMKYNGPRDQFPKKYLNENLDTANLSMREVNGMYYEFFYRKDYDWWVEVQEGDVVVDLGSSIGMFTLHALDKGASKVYSVEGSRKLMKTMITNLSDYWMDHGECPVVPINTMVGDKERYDLNIHNHVYSDDDDLQMISFSELRQKYLPDHIDYLKVDIEGGEYDVFTQENISFLQTNVKHMAIEFHLNCFREAPWEWIRAKYLILNNWPQSKVRFISVEDRDFANQDHDENFLKEWPINRSSTSVMLYITN